jgi:putative ABC transport system permease protein
VGRPARDAFPDAARGGTSGLHGRGARRLHAALVVGELTLAMVLAVSAGLLMKSFARLTAVDPGFRTTRIVRMKIDLPSPAYTRGRRTDQFFETVLRETSALPGVRSAALVSRFPLHDGSLTSNVLAQGAVYAEGIQLPTAEYRLASPGYFETMGIPLIAGRDFQSTDTADSTARHVAIINQAAAMVFFGTPKPLGKWLRLGGPAQPRFTVVGVIGDIHDLSLRDAPKPEVYISTHQGLPGSGTIVIRYDGAAPSIADGVRRIVSSLDRGVPVFDVQSIEAVMDAARVSERFTTTLLSGFALLALLLAAVGTYGVVAFGVAERTREIGVRMALGARSGDVLGMVLREGVLLFVMALPLALVGVWLAGRMVASLLFGVVSSDPATIAGSVLILGAATAVACFIPALRASRVDPTTAIRA